MKNKLDVRVVIIGVLGGLAAFLMTGSIPLAVAVFAGSIPLSWWKIYRDYAADNPQNLWFKRKLYGWGWTPVKWQGWLVIVLYAAVIAFIFTKAAAGSYSAGDTFIAAAPLFTVATVILFIVLLKKGEKPHWQWGEDRHDE